MTTSVKKSSKGKNSNLQLKEKTLKNPDKFKNFKSVYEIYLTLCKIYNNPPEGVSKGYWQDKVISALTAQPILNLPKVKKILYSGKISEKANRVVKRKGGLTKARKGSGDDAVTNEHYFPRKYVCKQMLDRKQTLSFEEFVEHWWTRIGVYHITTKAENAKLQVHIENMIKINKDFNPLNWNEIYSDCGIKLIVNEY